jgi:hypothetical protein
MSDGPTYAGNFPKAWEIVGRLISFWADYESCLYETLRHVIATEWWDADDDAVMILANGLRYGDAVSTLKRISKAKKFPKAALDCIDDIAREAAKVKAIRDVAAHRKFTIVGPEDWRFEFHLWNRRSKSDPMLVYYTPQEIELCASYARLLASRIRGQLQPLLKGRFPSEGQTQAWLDKPSLPKPPDQDFDRTRAGWSLQHLSLE